MNFVPEENSTVPCPHCGAPTTIAVPKHNVPPVISEFPHKTAETEAQARLGVTLFQGLGVPQDYGAAVKCFAAAAEHGHPEAQGNLAICYLNGFGVEKNEAEAIRWFRKAGEQGWANSQYDLGSCYASGYGVAQNDTEAVKWFQEAAQQGHALAQYALGLLEKDEAKAMGWLLKAAEQGHAEAADLVGRAYFLGEGVPANPAEACKWYFKAAKKGLATAQRGLALCYLEGRGVPQNYVEAYKFVLLAAAQGLEETLELRDAMKEILNQSQIEEGQLRAEVETKRLLLSANEENIKNMAREPIPSAVRREVWRRDEGKCARCGSREKLEYDHIVPVAKGGSNTVRNIELLCESCNRSKSHSIQ